MLLGRDDAVRGGLPEQLRCPGRIAPDARSALDKAGRLYREAKPILMTVASHSDKTGSEYPNLLLSAHRAEMVKQALVERGIPAERLEVVASGQTEIAAGETPARAAVITWR